MIESLAQKYVAITPPQAIVNGASWTCAAIDTLDADWADIIFQLGALDIAITALNLTECDTSGGSYTAVPNGDFSTGTHADGTAATLPSATDDNHFFAIHVDCRGRKRFLKLVATIGTGSAGGFMSAFAVLSRQAQTPSTAAGRGFTQELFA